jgi:hypothetical protein
MGKAKNQNRRKSLPQKHEACLPLAGLPAVDLAGYEDTKEEGGYIEQWDLFRAFQISCFRDYALVFRF